MPVAHPVSCLLAATIVVGPVNEYVVRTSVPEQVDAGSIYFTGVSHRETTINWLEPGRGDWEWPILGYEIQVTTTATYTSSSSTAADTDSDGVIDTAPVATTVADIDFDGLNACPAGEGSGATVGRLVSGEGCYLNAVAQDATTTQELPGLQGATVYYFRIRARNHDGFGEWSAASYGLLTHAVPNTPAAPVIVESDATALTIGFDTPDTTGTNDCAPSDLSNGVRPDAATYLASQKCTVALSTSPYETAPRSGVEGDASDDRDCATSDAAKTCQTVGAGSPVTAYRILMCKHTNSESCGDSGSYTELKDPTTGLAMYPMTDGTGGLLDSSGATDYDLTFTVTDLDPSSTYDFKVQATNSAGESAASAEVSGTTLGVPLQPHPPMATSIGEQTANGHTEAQITLTWNIDSGYCPGAEDTEPQPSAAYTSLTNDFPNEATLTTACPYDSGVALTGFRLFASSYSVLGTTAAQGGSWEPARRGSLTDDSTGTAYFSSPLDTVLPSGVDGGEWLEIDVTDGQGSSLANLNAGSFTVEHLSQDTYYKFAILFQNSVGDSPVSQESEYFLTLEAEVSDLKMHTSPPCIYADGSATRFVATSSGTNVFYKWQLPDGIQVNAHDTRSFGSVIAEAGAGATDRCKTTDCSVMEFVLPSISSNSPAYTTPEDSCVEDTDPDTAVVDCETGFTHGDLTTCPTGCTYSAGEAPIFTVAVVGYNTRGQTALETSFEVQYCGCTDPWDPAYWDQATYHIPAMCDHESWDGSDMTVIDGEFQFYQTFYYENTHSAQVILRVDEGEVDLYLSTEQVPDAAMDSTYFSADTGIQTWALVEIPYSDLEGSTSLYAAVQGKAAFSRFAIIASTREFTRGRGERYADGSTVAGSQDLRRTQLQNIEPQAFEIKTPYYDFFEYYFAKASNDVDVEIKVNCQLGCVDVFTSKIERFPSSLRKTDSYEGFWTAHNGAVCAQSQSGGGDQLLASCTGSDCTAVAYGGERVAEYATASFDGNGGVYGMVTFTQSAPTCTGGDGSCAAAFAAAADTSKASCPDARVEGSNEEGACTYSNEVTVSVSLKGLNGDFTWAINAAAVGGSSDGTGAGCASTGSLFSDDLPDLLGGTTHTSPDTIFANSATITTGDTSDTLTLFGEAVASASDGDATAQSILGRSVVISKTGSDVKYCATIYPDSTVTSYVGELSLMHTIRPEETVETCVSVGGNPVDCSTGSSKERMLFASVQGAHAYAVGAEQVNNEYTIEAKIYRYRVESNLLEPTVALSDTGHLVSQADAEDRRYSVVSIDNFNYYEVELSSAAYGLSVELTLHYGQIELYTSKYKLPTQDAQGHDNLFGDVHAAPGVDACPTMCFEEQADGSMTEALADRTAYNQFGVGRTYHITIPYSDVNPAGKYVFLGVLGTAPDSSYEISVSEYLFHEHQPGHAGVTGIVHGSMLQDDTATTATIAPESYMFFELYVGPADEAMYVTERSGAGSRTGDLGTDPDTWGIDWTEQLTQTWVEQQQDEWDLDVDVTVDVTGGSNLIVYGSSREPYPSLERGSDTDSTTGNLVIPHFTFSDKLVYISVFNAGNAPADITITPQILEMHLDQLTVDTDTTYPVCPGESGTRLGGDLEVCSGHGSCIGTSTDPAENTCYCDNGFLGDDCSIEAFSVSSGQPKLAISADHNVCNTATGGATDDAEKEALCTSASVYCVYSSDSGTCSGDDRTVALPGDREVIVPFTISDVPSNSKVHVYVDGLAYPAKGANVLYYTAAGDHTGAIEVYGMEAGVLHTVELLLLSADNIPLGTDMVDFAVQFAGGCANGCSGHGVCHHGYCVCHDGWYGRSCETQGEDVTDASFEPGAGFVEYNTAMMEQERNEDAYISKLKLEANANFLAISDSKIQDAHAAVVDKLNTFIKSNEAEMATLAEDQAKAADALHRKRDRITTTIQQMREESRRLKTANTEAYLETVRSLHENQRQMQNELDAKRLEHFQNMAVRHDEWVEIKQRNDFKLNQLRTANGPLVHIDDLEERECTQDDMFRTECVDVPSSSEFVEQPGYTSHGTVRATGTCTEQDAADPANAEREGYRCVCSYDADDVATCVQVEIDGEEHATLYHDIPR